MKHAKRGIGCYDAEGDRRAFENYYANQCGHGLPVFYGARMQRGHGIGSIFGGLFRTIFPIIKRVAPVIGRKALETGMQIAGDVAAGQSIKEAAKTRVVEAIEKGINKLAGGPSDQNQTGSGKPRKRAAGATTERKSKKKKKSTAVDIFSSP
jgi:hypothetical protein